MTAEDVYALLKPMFGADLHEVIKVPREVNQWRLSALGLQPPSLQAGGGADVRALLPRGLATSGPRHLGTSSGPRDLATSGPRHLGASPPRDLATSGHGGCRPRLEHAPARRVPQVPLLTQSGRSSWCAAAVRSNR